MDFLSEPVRRAGNRGADGLSTEEYYVRVESAVDIYLKRMPVEGNAIGRVLLLHGAGMDSSGFDIPLEGWSFGRLLAGQGWDVFMLDYRGHGRSSRVLDGSTIDVKTVVTDVAAVLNAIDDEAQLRVAPREGTVLTRWHVVGESFGSLVAPVLAAELGERIATVTLLGGIYGSLGGFADGFTELIRELAASPGGYAFTTEEEWSELFFRDVDPDVLRWHERCFGTAYAYPVGPYLAAAVLPLSFRLQDVTARVQIISGSEDVFFDRSSLQELVNRLPGSGHRLIVQDGVGHLPYVERKVGLVVEAIEEFAV